MCDRAGLCPGRGNRELLALLLNQPGRTTLGASYLFLSIAILRLANEAAGCIDDTGAVTAGCDERVFGFRPSSMVTLMVTGGGIATSLFMPYAGAVIDHTAHRRSFGALMATVLVLVNAAQAAMLPSTWFVLMILQAVLASASFTSQSMCFWAYLNDLVDSDLMRQQVISSMRFHEILVPTFYLLIVGAVALALRLDEVRTAWVAQGLAVVIGGPFLAASWYNFRPRPARHEVAKGRSLWVAGVRQLWTTISRLPKDEPDIFKLLLAVMLTEAGIRSYSSLVVTYLTQQLGRSGVDIVIFVLLSFACAMPGAILHRLSSRVMGHKYNMLAVQLAWILLAVFIVLILRTPAQGPFSVIFAVPLGIITGWVYPAMNGFFAALTPPGRDVELWGWFLFASNLMSWPQPLIFTAVNETIGDLRVGMATLVPFVVLAMLVTVLIGRTRFDSTTMLRSGEEKDDRDATERAANSPDPDS